MTSISASGVSLEVDGNLLIDSVDLQVEPGELVSVAGPNGAGKTTLLRVLAGDSAPTAGAVVLADRPVAHLTHQELATLRSFLGQERTSGIPFSVSDVVAMGGWLRGAGDDAVAQALRAMDLTALANRTVGTLSAGEHTRVELARILVQDTPILLLDEPLTALDVSHQEQVMTHLRGLAQEGRAVVVVLHELNVAAAYADRIVLMRTGRALASGVPSEVLDPSTLSAVYGHSMTVDTVQGRLVVVPEGPVG